MAKWNFFVSNTSLIKELDTSGNDVNPQSQSFLAPTLDLQGDKIVFKDNGSYKTAIMFPEIGEIDGVNPSDLQDAYDKIIAIIPNSGGGGGSTPDATTTVKGKLKLAGDLSGTADLPTVPGLANKQNTLTETNFGSFINGLTAKNTLVDADEVVSDDSADSNKAKKTSWLNVWLNYLKPKADALYAPIASVSTMVKLPADVTSTITTETVVSSFTYAVSANTTYIIRGRLGLGCNGTGGVNLGGKFPSGAVINGNALGRKSLSSDLYSAGFATSGTLSGGLNNVNSQGGFAFVEIVLSVGATAGDFELIFASVTAGQTSTVIAAGSYLEYIKL